MTEKPICVWFCSPEEGFAQAVIRALGPEFEVVYSDDSGLQLTPEQRNWCDAVILDLRAAEAAAGLDCGLRAMDTINRQELPPPVIVMLGDDEPSVILRVMENGAFDTLASPPDIVDLRLTLRRANKMRGTERELFRLRHAQSRSNSQMRDHMPEMIGASECMQPVLSMAQKIAPCDVSVLITGETGTGKEILARAVHRMSPRAPKPFVAFSCASLPETLIEDELFGHERGAFTGALLARRGRFEAADQGTLLLDEIGDLSLGLQAKLLRVLQQRTLERLGSNTPLAVNIRVIAATNRNLAEMVARGEFREDLYYRLNVVQLHLPPLRERRDAIPALACHFLRLYNEQFGKKVRRFSRLAMHAIEEHDWPGNVRELENVVQRAVVIVEGHTIELWHLPEKLHHGFAKISAVQSYEEEVRHFKRRLLLRTLRECGWCKAETARTLGVARNYLHRLIHQLEIRPEVDPTAHGPLDEKVTAPSAHVM